MREMYIDRYKAKEGEKERQREGGKERWREKPRPWWQDFSIFLLDEVGAVFLFFIFFSAR